WGRGPTSVLGLSQVPHVPGRALPRPSISAEPGSEIPRGRPVTIVCQAPAGAQDFLLEKEGSSQIWDKRSPSPSEREARFLFPSMSEDTAGRYHCPTQAQNLLPLGWIDPSSPRLCPPWHFQTRSLSS
uniref:Ig-like domain-containing protein n=1 Tax=Urocitellus parryii TaxID=9999 RepID=A0A8D2H9N5_UROPR